MVKAGDIPLGRVKYIACEYNRAHQYMGTQLLSVDDGEVVLRLPWHEALADVHGGISSLAVVAALDHACALAALVTSATRSAPDRPSTSESTMPSRPSAVTASPSARRLSTRT